jgi:hypothetical protein
MVNRRIAGVGGSEFSAMGWGRILPVVVVLWAGGAAAQAPWPAQQPQQQQAPWPGQQPPPQQQAPWPGQQQGQAAAPAQPKAAWPSPQQQPQGQAAWPSQHAEATPAAPPMMGLGGGVPGMTSPMGGPPGGQRPPPCFGEFSKLREEVEKAGAAASAGNARHAEREELCKLVTALSSAATKWAKFTVTKASGCGIPPDAVKQIKMQGEHLVKVKTQVCSAAPAAAAPSLAEALGTDRMPLDEGEKTTVKRGGVLDSLTGTPIR